VNCGFKNFFWQVGPCGLTWWAGQLGRWHLHAAYLVHNGK